MSWVQELEISINMESLTLDMSHRLLKMIYLKSYLKLQKKILPPQATPQATPQADPRIRALIEFCEVPKTRAEIQEFMHIKDRTYFRNEILGPLLDTGVIKTTIPDKPSSPNQKYYSMKIENQNNFGGE